MPTHEDHPKTTGFVLHGARFYDWVVWLFMLGREGAFREEILRFAKLAPGEAVLDVGCGTGTLAIAAKQRVGGEGAVSGIDASPEMIARAAEKARRAGVDATFECCSVESLPYPDGRFDAVLSTLMLHHLPANVRKQCASEMRRVLKPGGRILAVDFEGADHGEGAVATFVHHLISRFHRRHGNLKPGELASLLGGAGLSVTDSGPIGRGSLRYALGVAT